MPKGNKNEPVNRNGTAVKEPSPRIQISSRKDSSTGRGQAVKTTFTKGPRA